MKRQYEEDRVARSIRAAVRAETPDLFEAILLETEKTSRRPIPAGRSRYRRRAGRAALSAAFVAAAAMLLVFLRNSSPTGGETPLPTFPGFSDEPVVSGEFLEETGVVAKALGPAAPGAELQEQVLAPNQAAVIDAGSFSWNSPSKLALGDAEALYRIHLPFTLQFQANGLAAVTYTTSDGKFEKKLYADEMDEAVFQERVGLVNRSDGRRWGYETYGDTLRLPADAGEENRTEWSIELSLTGDASLSSYEVETMFRERISRMEIYVTLEFEDGATAGTLLRFRFSGKATGSLEAIWLACES